MNKYNLLKPVYPIKHLNKCYNHIIYLITMRSINLYLYFNKNNRMSE